ncbi:polysaccharide deacetylase family protein [Paenibacillus thailandensis]|jgi:biofilm PGA synthesis lipoprotein PgaB|uniref:Polysaccharide deacetylase family protein n=1 Tax=Paenibacillus thailandensis TaxID=393250 RepID=A0ABW5QXX1_9BACL
MANHYDNKVIVLTYHHVGAAGPYSLRSDLFRSHLNAIKEQGYNVIGIDAFLRFCRQGKVVSDAVLLTFDDGWSDFYTHAYPELSASRCPAVGFVIVSRIMKSNRLTWDQMREMERNGGIAFFSHSYDQHRKINGKPVLLGPIERKKEARKETMAEYRQRMKRDFRLAGQLLSEQLGRRPNLLCFPYGAYNGTVLKAAKDAGVELCFTTKKGINARGQYEIYRLNAGVPDMTPRKLLNLLKEYD